MNKMTNRQIEPGNCNPCSKYIKHLNIRQKLRKVKLFVKKENNSVCFSSTGNKKKKTIATAVWK